MGGSRKTCSCAGPTTPRRRRWPLPSRLRPTSRPPRQRCATRPGPNRMVSWGEFAVAEPDLAAAGRKLFTQYGLGLAFIATTAADGAPRLHPITIALTDDNLYA